MRPKSSPDLLERGSRQERRRRKLKACCPHLFLENMNSNLLLDLSKQLHENGGKLKAATKVVDSNKVQIVAVGSIFVCSLFTNYSCLTAQERQIVWFDTKS